MKKLILIKLLLITFQFTIAQTNFHPKSTITSATIYESGAMVTRTINTQNINSDGLVFIDSLPQAINPKSIQVKCGEGLKIISLKNTHKVEKIDDEEKRDSINSIIFEITDSIDYQNTLLKSIKKEIEVIHKNDKFSNEDGTNMEQLAKASALYKTNLRALNLEQLKITKKRDRLTADKRKLQDELMLIQPKTYKNLGVEIKLAYESNTDKTLTLSYFTPSAFWYTFYDLRVTSKANDSHLDHKAFVSQSTGEDWKDVKLTLSNRSPNKRVTPPTISPYILQNVRHHAYSQNTYKDVQMDKDTRYFHGIVTDANGEPLIGANVVGKSSSIGTITDIDGRFKLMKVKSNILVISYIGFQTQEVDASNLSFVGVTMVEGQLLDEIVVTGYADSKRGSFRSRMPKVRKKQEVRKSISVKPQESLNVHSFEIAQPYSIPSNGEEYDVLLNTNGIPFVYQYIAYPSEEPTAYLNVGIPDWRMYDLFSGKVNLFLEGQYTGISKLNIKAKTDTLWFSLGEDIGVHIEKEIVEEFNKKSFLKNKTIELHTFDIIVKNNKNRAIKLDIMDQVPISTDDDIKVKVLEISGAEYDEPKGFLTWKEALQPGESKRYRISYEIKYGKNVDIVSN